jgi:ANTAR domain-containing protein
MSVDPVGGEDWQARAEQLQGALDSRVMIEQAKGMLRERLGLPLELAFELLRSAARSSRQKLHVVAEEIVGSFETPDAVIEVLARHREQFLPGSREELLVQTEEVYRRVNDAIARQPSANEASFLCECSNPYCSDRIDVTADDIELLHSVPGYYVVAPGHDIPDVEDVVRETEQYMIVQKKTVV